MNFVRRRRTKSAIVNGVDLRKKYPHSISLYKEPPTEEIALEEFERFAIDRLKVLREVENAGIRFKRDSEEYIKKLKTCLKEFLPNDFETGYMKRSTNEVETFEEIGKDSIDRYIDRRKDHISHFILRLAFSRSEDLRRWFLMQEMDLFRYRFQQELPFAIDQFLKDNGLKYEPIGQKEKLSKINDLKDSGADLFNEYIERTDYYKVPFTEALDLVRGRKVYLEKGFAFIPREDLVSIIATSYRSHLSHSLVVTARKLPYLEEDDRILPMLKNLSNAYIGEVYTARKAAPGEKVTIDQLDDLSKKSYPLCMQQLHEHIRQNHHVKYFGRLQYGLFLKGIGLKLEEALAFWRSEFTKMMDVDKFDKQYAYNIRHSFGKEGKRADYTPYSCLKIITSNQPGPGDAHGCPFKHSDPEILQRRLQRHKVPKDSINEIIDLVKRQHYQVACAKYYESSHKLPDTAGVSINHPNQYFNDSVNMLKNIKLDDTSTSTQSDVTVGNVDSKETTKKDNIDNVDIDMDDFTAAELETL